MHNDFFVETVSVCRWILQLLCLSVILTCKWIFTADQVIFFWLTSSCVSDFLHQSHHPLLCDSFTPGIKPISPPPPEPFYCCFHGTTRVRRCQKRTSGLMVKERLREADTLTIRLGTTLSGLTSAHLHHPPFFERPDALPATQPAVSKHWRQLVHSD